MPKLPDSSMLSKIARVYGLYSDIKTTNLFFSRLPSAGVHRLSIITAYKHNNRLKGFRKNTKQALNILSSVSSRAKERTACLVYSKSFSSQRE